MSTGAEAISATGLMFNFRNSAESAPLISNGGKVTTSNEGTVKPSPSLITKDLNTTTCSKAIPNTEGNSTFTKLAATFSSSFNSKSETYQTAAEPLFKFKGSGTTESLMRTTGTEALSTTKVKSSGISVSEGSIGNIVHVTSVGTSTTAGTLVTLTSTKTQGSQAKVNTSGDKPIATFSHSKGTNAETSATCAKQPSTFSFSSIGNNSKTTTTSTKQPPTFSFSKGTNSETSTTSAKPPTFSLSKGTNSETSTTSTKQPSTFSFSKGTNSETSTTSAKPPTFSLSKGTNSETSTTSAKPPTFSLSKGTNSETSATSAKQPPTFSLSKGNNADVKTNITKSAPAINCTQIRPDGVSSSNIFSRGNVSKTIYNNAKQVTSGENIAKVSTRDTEPRASALKFSESVTGSFEKFQTTDLFKPGNENNTPVSSAAKETQIIPSLPGSNSGRIQLSGNKSGITSEERGEESIDPKDTQSLPVQSLEGVNTAERIQNENISITNKIDYDHLNEPNEKGKGEQKSLNEDSESSQEEEDDNNNINTDTEGDVVDELDNLLSRLTL